MLDELDRLPPDIDFGGFMKNVHATLEHKDLSEIDFIFAGQLGIYSRFQEEHRSFERLVTHIPLAPLDYEASEFILEHASQTANPNFMMEPDAKEAILGIASGHPDTLHLVGDSTYMQMINPAVMTKDDALKGIISILKSNKREKVRVQSDEMIADK
jgi:hypothetical protein